MATVTIVPVLPIILFGLVVGLISAAVIISNERRKVPQRKPYRSAIEYRSVANNDRYIPNEFTRQMELDMRLPYRRFKQLYPYSTWTYEEYKQMQMRSAFRRSTSSQDNKRMVR